MATIQFTTDRMNQIHNRIGETIQQLQQAFNSDQECLNNIATNIQSESMSGTLQSYAQNNVEKAQSIVTKLQKMDEFLMSQMSAYSVTDEEAQAAISEVQGILDQIQ